MSDRPSGWGAGDDPTVAMPAAGASDEPPTAAMPPVGGDDEPPERRPGCLLPIMLILLAVLGGVLTWVLLSGDEDDADDDTPAITSASGADDSTTSSSDPSATTSSVAPTTDAPTTQPPTTVPPTTTPPPPPPDLAVTSIEASAFTCPGSLVLRWTTEGATSVEVAIDTPGGVYDTGPPQGSMEVPAPCGGDVQTYYVTAIADDGDRSTQQLQLESG